MEKWWEKNEWKRKIKCDWKRVSDWVGMWKKRKTQRNGNDSSLPNKNAPPNYVKDREREIPY